MLRLINTYHIFMQLGLRTTGTLLGILILIGGGCGSTAPTTVGYKTYEIPGKQVTISYPSDWEINTQHPGTIVQIFAPLEDTTDSFKENINIVATDLSQYSITDEEFFDTSHKGAQALQDYQEVAYENTTLDGNPAKRLTYVAAFPTKDNVVLNLKFVQILTLKDKKSYAVTCTFKENSFDKYVTSCNNMVDSIKIQ